MNETIRIIAVCAIACLAFSCEKEEQEIEPSPYIGFYKIDSFTSDTAIDINLDGVAENDFLKELDINWFENDFNMIGGEHHITIRKSYLGNNVLYLTSFKMPTDRYKPDIPFLFMRFGVEGTEKYLTVKNSNVNSFEVSDPPFDIDRPEHTAAYPRYTSFTFLDETTLETRMDQKFYDEIAGEWKDVQLVAVFSKITDPDYTPTTDY